MLATLVSLGGCASESASSAELVSTNLTTYTVGDAVMVSWTELSGAPNDYIAIGYPGGGCGSYEVWRYTGGGTSGSMSFTGLPAGTYDARAYNMDGSDCAFRSAPFTIDPVAGSTVSTSASSHAFGVDIPVSWTSIAPTSLDWIAISPAGSPDNAYSVWIYTPAATGTHTFTIDLAVGNYEARLYANDSATVLARSAFSITAAGTPTLMTSQPSYAAGVAPVVQWTNLNPATLDWIALTYAGNPDISYITWIYVGSLSGSHTFTAATLEPGNYEARAFINNGFTRVATAAFTVTGAVTVTTDASTYAPTQDVTVNWSNLPGNLYDWVAIAPAGSANTTYITWYYALGAATGSRVFTMDLPVGTYVARAFVNDTFTLLDESDPFTVSAGATSVTVIPTSPAAGVGFQVSYSNMAGGVYDWIGVATVGSPPASYLEYRYTGGGTTGTVSFSGLPSGNYEARAYFDNENTIRATTPFTVP